MDSIASPGSSRTSIESISRPTEFTTRLFSAVFIFPARNRRAIGMKSRKYSVFLSSRYSGLFLSCASRESMIIRWLSFVPSATVYISRKLSYSALPAPLKSIISAIALPYSNEAPLSLISRSMTSKLMFLSALLLRASTERSESELTTSFISCSETSPDISEIAIFSASSNRGWSSSTSSSFPRKPERVRIDSIGTENPLILRYRDSPFLPTERHMGRSSSARRYHPVSTAKSIRDS